MLKSIASLPSAPGIGRLFVFAFAFLSSVVFVLVVGTALIMAAFGATLLAVIGPLVVIPIGAGVVTALEHVAALCGQHVRDLRAGALKDRLMENVDAGERFAVYLRPFVSTDQMRETRIDMSAMPMTGAAAFGAMGAAVEFELEAQIESAARGIGPLVALGEPLEHIGAGRIKVTDADWQAVAARLMDEAELIILLPSSRAGTLWEVDRILSSDLIERTVIVDPPNATIRGIDYDQAGEWAAVQAAFAEKDYALPDDDRAGRLVFFGHSKTPELSRPFSVAGASEVEGFFRDVVKRLERAAA
ncbi:MAG: hypothetical protein AAFQ67_04340 [Pseudomonadota bacterium]